MISKNSNESYIELKESDKLSILYPVNEEFKEVVDLNTYRLNDKNQKYDEKIAKCISNMTDRIRVRMRQSTFDPAEPIFIFNFLTTFKTPCDSNGISEETEMWPIHPCVNNPAASIIKARTQLRNDNCKTFEVALYLYCDVVQFLLSMYATDEVIAGQ